MCDVRFSLQEVRDPWLFLKLTPVPTGPFCSPQHLLKQHQRTWFFSLSWMMTRSYHEPKFGRLGLPDSSYTHPSHRPSGLSDRWIKSIWWKRMMFSTDFNPRKYKKGWFWWQNVRYPLFHSFTWSTLFNLILFEENWKQFAWFYIYVLLSGFFLVASRTLPVEFGDERFSWKNRVK